MSEVQLGGERRQDDGGPGFQPPPLVPCVPPFLSLFSRLSSAFLARVKASTRPYICGALLSRPLAVLHPCKNRRQARRRKPGADVSSVADFCSSPPPVGPWVREALLGFKFRLKNLVFLHLKCINFLLFKLFWSLYNHKLFLLRHLWSSFGDFRKNNTDVLKILCP